MSQILWHDYLYYLRQCAYLFSAPVQRLKETHILKWVELGAIRRFKIFDQSGVATSCTISSYVPTYFQIKRLKGTYSLQVTELLREHILSISSYAEKDGVKEKILSHQKYSRNCKILIKI